MTDTQYIIVGQGIAGTLLGVELERRGIEDFIILDHDHKGSSSMAAAGTINPVTGRNYVKSWIFEELRKTFEPVYSEMNTVIKQPILQSLPIIRSLHSIKEENMWLARMEDHQYQDYLKFEREISELTEWINKPQSFGIITQAWQLLIRNLLLFYKDLWKNKGKLVSDKLNYDDIIHHDNKILYKTFKSEKIIFCEGHAVVNNPYFNHLPFDPVKGEALIIHLNNGFTRSLRDKIFITPIGNDCYWCGANYEWKYTDDRPSSQGFNFVKSQLDEILKQPYEIVDHWAGIRPATKSRRPIIARNDLYPNMYIFNGLGTKGSSLAPYFASKLADIITQNT